MISAMIDGCPVAAEELLHCASWMTSVLQIMYKAKSDLFRGLVAQRAQIPVLARLDPTWQEMALEDLKRLEVGKEVAVSRFKTGAYGPKANVGRTWARKAVNVLDQNQGASYMAAVIGLYLLGENRKDIELMPVPEWVKAAAELPPFSKATVKVWGRVARRMIREQAPDFHKRPEFAELAASARMRLRDDAPGAADRRTGTIQNALLDRIVEAMESMAM